MTTHDPVYSTRYRTLIDLLEQRKPYQTNKEVAQQILDLLDAPTLELLDPPRALITLGRTHHNAEQIADLKRQFAETPYRLQVLPPDPEPADTRRTRNQHRLESWCWAGIGFALGFAAAALALGAATTPY